MDFKKWDALHTTLRFGKHKGETLEEILESDPSYLQWLLGIATEGSLLQSLEVIKDDIAEAVELDQAEYIDDLYEDLYKYSYDPMYD